MKIHKQANVAKIALEIVETEAQSMLEYLSSDKFQGVDNDYIRTWEVTEFIQRIKRLADFELVSEVIGVCPL